MDPLSLAASIIALLQLTSSVVQYIGDVADGREERIGLRNEISSTYGPLHMLHDRIVAEKKRLDAGEEANESWLSSVMQLGVKNGPMRQYERVLEELQVERDKYITPSVGKLKKVKSWGKALAWPISE